MEQITECYVMCVPCCTETLIAFQSHFSTVRGYNLIVKTALIDIDRKEVFHVCPDRFGLSALVPRPRWCGPARLKYQFR